MDKDDLDKRYRDVEGAIEDGIQRHRERLKASQGWGLWKGLTSRQRALYGTLAALVVLGILAMLFGG